MLNLSGVSIGASKRQQQDQQQQPSHHHHHQQQQNQLPPLSGDSVFAAAAATTTTTTAASGGGVITETLFEDEVPVHIRNMDREEVCQELGVCVQVAKNGPYRSIHVRLTDPRDPFFLYNMSLSEDDYGRFKDKHELSVDFAGFPRDLVSMLAASQTGASSGFTSSPTNTTNIGGITTSSSTSSLAQQQQHHTSTTAVGVNDTSMASTAIGGPTILSFVISEHVQGTLRILEKTGFRLVEHLSLSMVKQGDVGQKQYLAERFRFFHNAFLNSEGQRRAEHEQMSKQISDFSAALEEVRADRDSLRQANAVQVSEHKLELAATSERIRETHEEQNRTVITEQTALVEAMKKQHATEQARTQQELQEFSSRLQQTNYQLQQVEQERLRLTSEVAQKTEALASSQSEVQRLGEQSDELLAFKKAAVKEKTEMDLQAVASTERVKHLNDMLKLRDEENSQIRRQSDTNDSSLRRSNDQLDSTRKKLDETEQSLAKAHHIIATHLQAIKSSKEKQHALINQVQAAEKVAQDKSLQCERIHLETAADREKASTLTSRVSELKDQLQRAEEQNNTLATDLKQSQEALLHLGRQTSSMPNRTWASSASSTTPAAGSTSTTNTANTTYTGAAGSSTAPLSSSSLAPAPLTLMREFARGNTTAGGAGDSSIAATGGGIGGNAHYNPASTSTSHLHNRSSYGTSSSSYTPSTNNYTSSSRTPGGIGSSHNINTNHFTSSSAGRQSGGSDPVSMLKNVAAYGTTTPSPSATMSSYFPS